MREDTLSKYKNYVTASKAKVFFANFADYLLTFILTFVVFAVAGSPIFTSLPETQASFVAANEHIERFYQIVDATHIQRYNREEVSLSNIDHDAKNYLTTLVKTTYFILDKNYPYAEEDGYDYHKISIAETLVETENRDYDNDPLGYYFYYFKSQEESLNFYTYDGVDYATHKADYLYLKAYGFQEADFELRDADYPLFYQLSDRNADILLNYLVFGDMTSSVTDVYARFAGYYANAVDVFSKEVQSHYDKYIEENANFDEVIANYDLRLMLTYTFSFLAAWAILEFILPLFLKEGRTIGVRSLKLSYATKEDLTPDYLRFVIKSLARLALHYSSIFFILVIMDSVSIAFMSIHGFSFAIFFIISAILGLGSIVLETVFKSQQGIPELLSGLVLKDTTQMEAGNAIEDQMPEGK